MASDSWRNATFRNADEDDFLNKYGQLPHGPTTRSPASTASCARAAPQVARDLLPKLPPDYQPLANARLAMATKAADAATLLRGVPAAKLDEPAIKLERLAWLRRTGNLDEAKSCSPRPAAATRPTPGGTSASSLRATCWRPAAPPTPMR